MILRPRLGWRVARPTLAILSRPLFAVRSTTIVATSSRLPACSLCDEEDISDWSAHARTPSHITRQVLGQMFAAPEREEQMMKQLWDTLNLDCRQVDVVNGQRQGKRRARLHSTLCYLRDMNVLVHSRMREDMTSSRASVDRLFVSKEFAKFAHIGETCLQAELTDRICRLMPRASAVEIASTVAFIADRTKLATLYAILNLDSFMQLTADACPVPLEWRALACVALIGELQLFCARERQVSVDASATAERVVLCVLATHCKENIISELVYDVLQPVVEESSAAWKEYTSTMRDKAATVFRPPAPKLSHVPTSPPVEPPALPAHDMPAVPDTFYPSGVARRRSYSVAWSRWQRGTGTLELTVPGKPVNKMALFAAPLPKMSLKARSDTSSGPAGKPPPPAPKKK